MPRTNLTPPIGVCARLMAGLRAASLFGPWLGAAAAGAADVLPPVLPWHGSSEQLIARPDNPWITPSEKNDLVDTPDYDETIAWLKRLAAASPRLSLQEFGRTSQGRALYVVVAAKGKEFTPEALKASRRPVLLAQAGIHSGEIDGKDAGLMLLRDIAVGGKESLLDHASFLFVPIFNADGHERASEFNRPNQRGPVRQGWRTTAQNLNLNRDYMKADTPEMRGMLALVERWAPALYLDLHVTDGLDYQYDITFGYNGDFGAPAWSPRIGAWLNQIYRPAVESALKAAGHTPGPLVETVEDRDVAKGLSACPAAPRYSHGYGDLRHLASVLVENHSLKPYRQRVLGTYILLEASLRVLGAHADKMQHAVEADRKAAPAALPLGWDEGGAVCAKIDFLGVASETYLSPATGGAVTRWLGRPKLYPEVPVYPGRVRVDAPRPKAYWVPATKPDVIDRLRWHGVSMETQAVATTLSVEMYRLVNPEPRREERSHPYEGRHALKTGVKAERRTELFPTGSVRVTTDQPLGDLVMGLLEPACDDSLFGWGFFLEVLQRTEYIEPYVLGPMAEQMLAENPKLKSEFEAKLAADPKFAADRTARLQWFYARSPYYDERYLLYPVGVER